MYSFSYINFNTYHLNFSVTNVPGTDGNQYEITSEYLTIQRQTFTEHGNEFLDQHVNIQMEL